MKIYLICEAKKCSDIQRIRDYVKWLENTFALRGVKTELYAPVLSFRGRLIEMESNRQICAEMGMILLRHCDLAVVYDETMTEGMEQAIREAVKHSIPVSIRDERCYEQVRKGYSEGERELLYLRCESLLAMAFYELEQENSRKQKEA